MTSIAAIEKATGKRPLGLYFPRTPSQSVHVGNLRELGLLVIDFALADRVRARRGLPFMHDVEGYSDTVFAGPVGKPTRPDRELRPEVPLINFCEIGPRHCHVRFRCTWLAPWSTGCCQSMLLGAKVGPSSSGENESAARSQLWPVTSRQSRSMISPDGPSNCN